MNIHLISFGFDKGIEPPAADISYDVRTIRNPHRRPEFRKLTGQDPAVQDDMLATFEFREFLEEAEELIKRQRQEQLTVAIGCSKGRHRSVASSELLAERLRREGHEVQVFHRELS